MWAAEPLTGALGSMPEGNPFVRMLETLVRKDQCDATDLGGPGRWDGFDDSRPCRSERPQPRLRVALPPPQTLPRAAADVWSFRLRWQDEQERLTTQLIQGTYRFELLSRVTLRSGEEVDIWSARDAVVLKALSLVVAEHLALSKKCCHLKGHGGSKQAVRDVLAELPRYRFVLKTDIRLYYASIDHHLLLDRLERFIADRRLLNLIIQYLVRSAERSGLFWHYSMGISLGCPLSPVLGAFFLRELDLELERHGFFFRRYMDDIVVLAPTRARLRRAVKIVNRTVALLKLEKHPEKTFIGKIDKGFDFLGYHFTRGGLSIARKTIQKFVERATRLYERERGGGTMRSPFGLYVRRWAAWATAGLAPGSIDVAGADTIAA